MKKKFEKSELEIVEINSDDILTVDSGINGKGDKFFESQN